MTQELETSPIELQEEYAQWMSELEIARGRVRDKEVSRHVSKEHLLRETTMELRACHLELDRLSNIEEMLSPSEEYEYEERERQL
jgi:hypothetical protein